MSAGRPSASITVRLFAQARELIGRTEVTLAVPPGLTARELRRLLGLSHPDLSPLLDRCAIAVNRRYASPAQAVREGDEIALIPPVAGG